MPMWNVNHRAFSMRFRGGDGRLEGGRVIGFASFGAEIAFDIVNLAWNTGRFRIIRANSSDGFRLQKGCLWRETAGWISALAAEIMDALCSGDFSRKTVVGRDKLEVWIEFVATDKALSVAMPEGDGRSVRIISRRFYGGIEDDRRHNILNNSALRRCKTADMAVLYDRCAMRILLNEKI